MLKALKSIFGPAGKEDFSALIKNGALVLDVRSIDEYESGHVNDSINIPVYRLEENLHKLKDKNKTIITCCASGIRSSFARKILKLNGYTNVHNGGRWKSLDG